MNELPQRQVDALGIETNYHYAGSAADRPLLLLHGTSTSGDSFRELMYGLADRYFLIAPDIPGFGFSDNTEPYTLDHLIEWLASFIDQLQIESLTMVGHSFGGLLASAYTLNYPEDVAKLVLLSPALLVGQKIPSIAKSPGTARRVAGAGIALSRMLMERLIRIQFHEPERMEEGVWDRRRADYSRARASAAAVSAVATVDLTPRLANIDQPTLVIWGRDDPVLAASQAARLEYYMKNIRIQMLDSCGHVPMIEQSEEVIRISRDFIQ